MRMICTPLSLALSAPFVSHKGTTTAVEHILVQLHWQGLIGYGVAIPSKDYNTTFGTLQEALLTYSTLLSSTTPLQIHSVLNKLEHVTLHQPAALAAIDMALHDLLGKTWGLPLYHLLGLQDLSTPSSALSLSIDSIEKTLDRLQQFSQWPIIKIKMSQPNFELIERISEVYAGRIWIDGNGAWNLDQAIRAVERFNAFNIEIIEQPLATGSYAGLKILRKKTSALIIADEDCKELADIYRLKDCVDGINIKLLKCGGIKRAVEMINAARNLGLRIMLGCKTESSLGITAVAHLAGLADFLDIDGHLNILEDPFQGVNMVKGKIILPTTPGLGVTRR